jgi:uncharacterized protein (UPF0261 family)
VARIVVAGAFDTKAEPFARLVRSLSDLGEAPITLDTGVFGSDVPSDHPAAEVAAAAGHALTDLPALGRAAAVAAMAEGAARIVRGLVVRGDVGALVCMGGSNAASLFVRLAAELPIGVPRLLMATVVAGETRPLVAGGGAVLLYPIVDIEGENGVLRTMIDRLARSAVAALRSEGLRTADAERSAALSMYGVTTPCVARSRALLAEAGYEALVFHGNGTGGRSLEAFAGQGLVSLVLDVTISELADELFGGLWSAGPERLTGAARAGVAQVVAPGAIDMINFGAIDSVPERYRDRTLHRYNDLVTLVRTTPKECRALGRVVAERLGEPTAPTAVMVPLRGVSALDIEGGALFLPEAVAAFAEGVRERVSPRVRLVELDLHINDPAFAEALVAEALATRGEG